MAKRLISDVETSVPQRSAVSVRLFLIATLDHRPHPVERPCRCGTCQHGGLAEIAESFARATGFSRVLVYGPCLALTVSCGSSGLRWLAISRNSMNVGGAVGVNSRLEPRCLVRALEVAPTAGALVRGRPFLRVNGPSA